MKLLLDTATILWHYLNDPRLSAPARDAVADKANRAYVSAVSYWEISIKKSLGKLVVKDPMQVFVQLAVYHNGFQTLPLSPEYAETVAKLPFHHRDPFDRLIVAQAIVDGMTIVSPDVAFDLYGVARIW